MLKKPIAHGDNILQVGCSVGIRMLGAREEGIHAVIREADNAMYFAKHSGNGQVVFYEEAKSQGAPGVVSQGASA
jgi:GGDEF domain-containing protein